jgi:hypothetical protein
MVAKASAKAFRPLGLGATRYCQGTMRMVQAPNGELCFALTAPFGNARDNMTLSYSCGYSPKIWKHDRVLYSGPSAYSAMDTSRDGDTLFALYERGVKGPYEEIHLAQILTPAWSTPAAPPTPILVGQCMTYVTAI